MSDVESRRYRILGVLGQGGFGKVYRARLEGPDGFHKDVAVKLLKDDDVPDDALRRFRDEARILGLVRDRAIVHVDPPTRLNGRLAVVMEYVDGVSCALILKELLFPPQVALEIVQEVARALDKVYYAPGPKGTPLQLLHRDLKPGNLQITPSGEIKILDFGIARADFEEREASTNNNIAGTLGYMAPERLSGEELPAGDVFSLGVLLHVLMTGDRPTAGGHFQDRGRMPDRTAPEVASALVLAREMMNLTPEERPVYRAVEDRCGALRSEFPGTTLRRWAERHVPNLPKSDTDELVGAVLTETVVGTFDRSGSFLAAPPPADGAPITTMMAREPEEIAEPAGVPRWVWGALAAGFALVACSGIAGVAALNSARVPAADAQVQPVEVVPAATPTPVNPVVAQTVPVPAEPAVAAAPAEPVVSTAAPVSKPTKTTVEPPPGTAAPVEAPPAPIAVVAEPQTTVETPPADTTPKFPVAFGSTPLGAEVYVDGAFIGKTPTAKAQLTAGDHKLSMKMGDQSIDTTITVSRKSPVRWSWKNGAVNGEY